MIAIQKELYEMTKIKKRLANDILECYIDYAALYSKECWTIFLGERLRRMENEICIY